ncbi:type II toxin-antitoxin system PemK/MazF family toxin [Candidatus Poribacteria bacterium]|nr:MAG: type II toxin-antitoxin system PemK/MazF family toxin [Candidatus Poribacteria bacterium]
MRMPKRGEIWLADLGVAAKTRPVLVLSVPFSDSDYALITVVPHTTSSRRSNFEVNLSVAALRPGAFNVQGLMAVPPAKFIRKLGALQSAQMAQVTATVKKWLGFSSN